jgi:hypothetical protein
MCDPSLLKIRGDLRPEEFSGQSQIAISRDEEKDAAQSN